MVSRRGFLAESIALGSLLFSRTGQALEPGRPSRTARGVALQRAAHQLLETPRVFDDPLALRVFGAEGVAWLGRNLERYRRDSSRAMRAFLVMRSRYAEDLLVEAAARGVRQCVVLGAGLDTFGYRNPIRDLRTFEVDHPDTQRWKRDWFAGQGIAAPSSLTFAPVDFERQKIADGLRAAGFRDDRPAFFSWLGVVVYLSKEAVTETLRFAASCAPGSGLVFDYSPPADALNEAERAWRAAAEARVASLGEPWVSYFGPRELRDQLLSLGFSSAQSADSSELNQRYFDDRTDGFRLRGAGRMMAARV